MRNFILPLLIGGMFVSIFAGWAVAYVWDRRAREREEEREGRE